MSTQEILIEELKHQPEPVLREVWRYLNDLKRQREEAASQPVELPARMDGVIADTWEKLGPAPELDLAQL